MTKRSAIIIMVAGALLAAFGEMLWLRNNELLTLDGLFILTWVMGGVTATFGFVRCVDSTEKK